MAAARDQPGPFPRFREPREAKVYRALSPDPELDLYPSTPSYSSLAAGCNQLGYSRRLSFFKGPVAPVDTKVQ
jgi:hypothetical protein